MKILIVNTCGTYTSTGNIVTTLYKYLKDHGHDVIVCFGYRNGYNDDFIKVCSKLEYLLSVFMCRIFGVLGFNVFSTRKLIKIIDKFNPDIIQLYNLHGYYINDFQILDYIKKRGIKVVYSMLDEYPYMGKCAYPNGCEKYLTVCNKCPNIKNYPKSLFVDNAHLYFKKKQTIYEHFDKIVFTGPKWVINRASKSQLLSDKRLIELNEPINTRVFYSREKLPKMINLNMIKEKIVILTVAVLSDPRKGGRDFIELAKRFANQDKYLFVYVGYDIDIKHDSNLISIPYVYSQDELAEYMSMADLFICNSKEDTMPNVCLDSLLCGTPILCYNVSGMPYLAPSPLGAYVDGLDSMEKAIIGLNKKNSNISKACALFAKEKYGFENIFNHLINIYNTI